MRKAITQALLAPILLATLLLGNRPAVAASGARPGPTAAREVAASPTIAPTPGVVAPADPALEPCRGAPYRAGCAHLAGELGAYGLDVADVASWSRFGLRRMLGGVELLADALGGDGLRDQRIACLAGALATGRGGGRVRVAWEATPQWLGDLPIRGAYGTNTLYLNPNSLFLDQDTPEQAVARAPADVWWHVIHELAHLWDERSAPAAPARHAALMQRWVEAQQATGRADVYPSLYAATGGAGEAFAESVAATVTGDAALRSYDGSPRDVYVRLALRAAASCRA